MIGIGNHSISGVNWMASFEYNGNLMGEEVTSLAKVMCMHQNKLRLEGYSQRKDYTSWLVAALAQFPNSET